MFWTKTWKINHQPRKIVKLLKKTRTYSHVKICIRQLRLGEKKGKYMGAYVFKSLNIILSVLRTKKNIKKLRENMKKTLKEKMTLASHDEKRSPKRVLQILIEIEIRKKSIAYFSTVQLTACGPYAARKFIFWQPNHLLNWNFKKLNKTFWLPNNDKNQTKFNWFF